jgi:hypothetical protein
MPTTILNSVSSGLESLRRETRQRAMKLIATIDQEIGRLQRCKADIVELGKLAAGRPKLPDMAAGGVAMLAPPKQKHRQRSSPEELRLLAQDLIAEIKRNGKKGISGTDLRAYAAEKHHGYNLQLIMPFLDQWAKGHPVEMVGERNKARYVAS